MAKKKAVKKKAPPADLPKHESKEVDPLASTLPIHGEMKPVEEKQVLDPEPIVEKPLTETELRQKIAELEQQKQSLQAKEADLNQREQDLQARMEAGVKQLSDEEYLKTKGNVYVYGMATPITLTPNKFSTDKLTAKVQAGGKTYLVQYKKHRLVRINSEEEAGTFMKWFTAKVAERGNHTIKCSEWKSDNLLGQVG